METASAAAIYPKTRVDGHLSSLSDWSPNVALYLATQQGIHLTDAHWEIIHLMRAYYQTYNISPIHKLLLKEIKEKLGEDKANDDYLTTLFPGDVLQQGVLIAGIPVPLLDAEMQHDLQKHSAQYKSTQNGLAGAFRVQEIQFQNRAIKLYGKGNLVNLDEWSPELAEFLAEKEGISLTTEHWTVINFLREFYRHYGIAPMVKLMVKHIRQQFGADIGNNEYLYKLFPKGPARQGSRIAGLPEPQGCIDP